MTRRAQLVDGTVLEFPDETPDEVMHRTVKRHLGLPVSPTPEQLARSEDVQLAAVRNRAISGLAQPIAQLTQVVAQLCEDQRATQEILRQLVEVVGQAQDAIGGAADRVAGAVAQLQSAVDAAAERVAAAVTAPMRQEFRRGEDGKIIETTISRGAN